MANHLSPLLMSIIHKDQVEFVPAREARDTTTKTLHLMSFTHCNHLSACLLSWDAEKNFDRVNWSFLRQALVQIGLGPRMLSHIISLYYSPFTMVTVNGTRCDVFSIANGTLAGLSPITPVVCHCHGISGPGHQI